jgi:hypothetical protein
MTLVRGIWFMVDNTGKGLLQGQFFLFLMWGGDLPCENGEAVVWMGSLAQHTSVSRVTLATSPYHQ